jgi:hypothetical protein
MFFFGTCLAGMSCVVHAQGLPDYTLQETVLVPVTGASVSSQTTLLQGVSYRLRAIGTSQLRVAAFPGDYDQGDAEYAFQSGGFLFLTRPANNCRFPNVDIGLAVNDTNDDSSKTPMWGPYNNDHTYFANFTGAGAPINLNYHNCSYVGSQGLLTVQIFRPMGMTLTGVPPSFTDVSPGLQTFPSVTQQSVSGRANALAVNGSRLYAGTFAGVWRSDDAGLRWRQMTQPQPPAGVNTVTGALYAPDVYDIAISPQNPDVVMIAVKTDLHVTPMNGIYRSEDGGATWTMVKKFDCSGGGPVTQIVFAPDSANLVYAAGGCGVAVSENAGKTWVESDFQSQDAAVWHVAVGPNEPPVYQSRVIGGIGGGGSLNTVRRVYALGSNQMYYSIDGGQSWTMDSGLTAAVMGVGGAAAENSGNSSRVLMVEPGHNQHVLLAVPSLSNGPTYYTNARCGTPATVTTVPDGTRCNTSQRPCGEGSMWFGDFSGFVPSDPNHHAATWTQLPSPPTYWGVTTPSGNVYLDIKPLQNNYLVLFSDKSHVHVSMGRPADSGWHRIEGLDASQTGNSKCNTLFVHADPHAIAFSTDFSLTLQPVPSSVNAPYNENTVAGPISRGSVWMANDGGVYHSFGATPSWRPASGLSTLATINVAGLAVKGLAPALFFGSGDNADFYSLDGGSSWNIPINNCGDCDAWFADPAQVGQTTGFMPYAGGGGFYVFTNNGKYPDAQKHPTNGTTFAHWVCPTNCNASSSYWIRGYKPMVMTLQGETAPATGDYVVIGTKTDGSRAVFRKTNAAGMNAVGDWENVANAVQYGPNLPGCPNAPACLDVVQAAGGHGAPVLYAGDTATGLNDSPRSHFLTLWKWTPGTASWQQIVPSPSSTPYRAASQADRFYVDPYNPNTIYLMDSSVMKRSDDGGATWQTDTSLDNAITENHRYAYFADYSVIKDMIFVRGEDKTRFAVGNAGVFYTLDGANWRRLLSTSAFPSHPVAAYFDNISDPCDRALYVGMAGRGILRIDPIPAAGTLGVTGTLPCTRLVNAPLQ